MMKENRLRKVLTCAKTGYYQPNTKIKKLELKRLKKKTRKTENDLEKWSRKNIKDLYIQIKMVKIKINREGN